MNKHTAALLAQHFDTALLAQHFDTAFAAPNGIKKLRELILTLAMQGKLVPQDPSDPPASELLKEIEAEKKRLVKAGKIKAPKPLPPVAEEEKPYELPQGWKWVRLGEIFSIVYGKGLPTSNLTNEGYDVFGANGIIGKYSKFLYESPQLLVSCRGAYSGKPNVSPPFCFVTSNSLVLENTWEYLRLEFFFFAIEIAEKTKIVTGSAQPQVTTTNLEPFLVPLPPLPEQHRIVAKIDELMARCDELEKMRTAQDEQRMAVHAAAMTQLLNIAQIEEHQRAQVFLAEHFGELYTVKENVAELRKAILQLAVMGKLVPQDPSDPPASELLKEIEAEKKRLVKEGKIKAPKPLPPVSEEEKPYALPKGWEWVRMGNICLGVTSGTTPPKDLFSEKSGIPFLKVYNIRNQKIDFEYKKQFVDANHHRTKMARSKLVPGDVVMNIVGPPLGKVAVIPDDYPEYNCNQAIVVFRPIERKTNGYLYVYLLAGKFLDAIELVGTAGQDNISVTKSQMMPIPLPPLPEQHRIVARIDQLMALCDSLDRQIDAATTKQTALLDAMMAQV